MNKEEMLKLFEDHSSIKPDGYIFQLDGFKSDCDDSGKAFAAILTDRWVGFRQGCEARQPEIDQLKELVYFVDQGEVGERITYKDALMGAESSAKAWKAAYKTHKAEVERLKAEIVDLKNALYEAQGKK